MVPELVAPIEFLADVVQHLPPVSIGLFYWIGDSQIRADELDRDFHDSHQVKDGRRVNPHGVAVSSFSNIVLGGDKFGRHLLAEEIALFEITRPLTRNTDEDNRCEFVLKAHLQMREQLELLGSVRFSDYPIQHRRRLNEALLAKRFRRLAYHLVHPPDWA